MKKCAKCFVEKTDDNFYWQKNQWGKHLYPYCKPCVGVINKDYRSRYKEILRERKKKYYYANIEIIKKRASGKYKRYAGKYKARAKIDWLVRKYGITGEKFEEIRSAQNNKCDICETEFVTDGMKTNFGVDHCHKTGKIRSLLCKKCNSSMGISGDSIGALEKMITYLKKHGVTE